MDVELIIYIIFVAIAILTRVLKGRKADSVPPPQQSDSQEPTQKRPERGLTFEELLRDFTGEGQPSRRPEPEPEEDPFSYEEEYSNQQEAAYIPPVTTHQRKLKTLDEQVSLDEPLARMEHFKNYDIEEETSTAREILESLQEEDGAKKAIIMSEIISRKYY